MEPLSPGARLRSGVRRVNKKQQSPADAEWQHKGKRTTTEPWAPSRHYNALGVTDPRRVEAMLRAASAPPATTTTMEQKVSRRQRRRERREEQGTRNVLLQYMSCVAQYNMDRIPSPSPARLPQPETALARPLSGCPASWLSPTLRDRALRQNRVEVKPCQSAGNINFAVSDETNGLLRQRAQTRQEHLVARGYFNASVNKNPPVFPTSPLPFGKTEHARLSCPPGAHHARPGMSDLLRYNGGMEGSGRPLRGPVKDCRGHNLFPIGRSYL
eukprot:PhM_4_TR16488/c0_g1_i1/m.44344